MSHYNTVPQTGGCKAIEMYFQQFCGLKNSKSKTQVDSMFGEGLTHGSCFHAAFSASGKSKTTKAEGSIWFPLDLSIIALNSFTRVKLTQPDYPLKALYLEV